MFPFINIKKMWFIEDFNWKLPPLRLSYESFGSLHFNESREVRPTFHHDFGTSRPASSNLHVRPSRGNSSDLKNILPRICMILKRKSGKQNANQESARLQHVPARRKIPQLIISRFFCGGTPRLETARWALYLGNSIYHSSATRCNVMMLVEITCKVVGSIELLCFPCTCDYHLPKLWGASNTCVGLEKSILKIEDFPILNHHFLHFSASL